MIPVEDNWLHIKHEFHEACNNLNNNSFIDNLMTFRNLGLFKLLLDKKYNGLSGHPQDFLECVLAIAEHDVTVAHEFAKGSRRRSVRAGRACRPPCGPRETPRPRS